MAVELAEFIDKSIPVVITGRPAPLFPVGAFVVPKDQQDAGPFTIIGLEWGPDNRIFGAACGREPVGGRVGWVYWLKPKQFSSPFPFAESELVGV